MYLSAPDIPRTIITPFVERTVHPHSGMSYGLSYAGYDVRIREAFLLEPNEFVLASVLEYIDVPNNVVAEVRDKSSLARLGLAVQNTIIEPGWRGFLTLELKNEHHRDSILIYAEQPIAQIMFSPLSTPVEGYKGKYQNQPARPVECLREET